ncbi:hypothetical protein [Bosea sp. AS-1]|jgi:hypothetical protein|uniref:hypothetical protein n=1 Tax=Bosea sp. AS-1 TaxID=2015316 RepID=UPI000B778DAF|nr:hypothetical protein [Bosea sp. AS-1]
MGGVTEADVAAVIGRIDEIIIQEVVRTQASPAELRQAVQLARDSVDIAASDALSPRMQRLVDLVAVALPDRAKSRHGTPLAVDLPRFWPLPVPKRLNG